MIAALEWTKVAAGRYTSPGGYTIEREASIAQFGFTHVVWHVTLDGQAVEGGSSLAKAKVAAERHATKKRASLCWFPSCSNAATGTTPGHRVSLPGDIDTCDACHRRATGRPRTET
jgi:hypothetical protein